MSAPREQRPLGRQLLRQLPYALWLVVVWLALWGDLSVLTVVSGILVAVFVVRFFYLPPAESTGRFNPYRFAILIGMFVADLVRASFEVAWLAIRPRPVQVSSVIQVDLRTTSDLVMTLTAEAVTLVPGSFVVEVDRPNTILYLHVLDARSAQDCERMRRAALRQEERIIRAIGSADDVRRVNRWHEQQVAHPLNAGNPPIRPNGRAQP